MDQEKIVWIGEQGQIVNLKTYIILGIISLPLILSVVGIPFIIPIIPIILYVYFSTKANKYELTTERLKTYKGIFSKTVEDLELYRVTDTKVEQPFLLNIFGYGNIVLITSDRTTPIVKINAIKDAKNIREQIRTLVEARRDKKQIQTVEHIF